MDRPGLTGCTVVCGMISQYNKPAEEQYAIKGITSILSKRLRVEGFGVTDPSLFKYRDERDEKMIQVGAHCGIKRCVLT